MLKHLCLESQVLSKPLGGSVLHMEECWTTHQKQELMVLMGHSSTNDTNFQNRLPAIVKIPEHYDDVTVGGGTGLSGSPI